MSTLPIFIKRCNCFNTKEHLLCLGHCCENNIVTWLLIILLKDQQQHEDPKSRFVVMLVMKSNKFWDQFPAYDKFRGWGEVAVSSPTPPVPSAISIHGYFFLSTLPDHSSLSAPASPALFFQVYSCPLLSVDATDVHAAAVLRWNNTVI
jgi:hypothetical protein